MVDILQARFNWIVNEISIVAKERLVDRENNQQKEASYEITEDLSFLGCCRKPWIEDHDRLIIKRKHRSIIKAIISSSRYSNFTRDTILLSLPGRYVLGYDINKSGKLKLEDNTNIFFAKFPLADVLMLKPVDIEEDLTIQDMIKKYAEGSND